ncbi:Fur family transcriptional regulator [Williamsoniiplasma somnilux]|uniref:Fur family transcriptional regulator n=1 Tax=Williamsoniiplasma somnilux TaxID=215578 RepID=A0A2K8NZC5_9MOLU|nr:transcriptional repressor [Williamsoniiplasma somnilux]ATZ18568.1 Fur family transcriptional regulator [Williamsoniiplasma somnilux]
MPKLNNQQNQQYEKIANFLRNEGFRLTEIRLSTIKVIIKLDHPTTMDIIAELQKEYKNINVMSVYNTIDLLLQKHIIFSNTFNGKQICYEIATNKSMHLKCDNCGQVQEIKNHELDKIQILNINEIAKNHSITADHFKIEVHGTCAKCALK